MRTCQYLPIPILDRCVLDIPFPTEQPCGVIHFLHVPLFCCFLSFPGNVIDSLSLIPPAAPLYLCILHVVSVCCGQLLIPCLGGLHLSFQLTSFLDNFPGVFTHPLLPFPSDLAEDFLAGGRIHLLDLVPLIFQIRLHLLIII